LGDEKGEGLKAAVAKTAQDPNPEGKARFLRFDDKVEIFALFCACACVASSGFLLR